jgi:hypothetical protein
MQQLEPELPTKDARKKQMIKRFSELAAKSTTVIILQIVTVMPVHGPTPIEEGQPHE